MTKKTKNKHRHLSWDGYLTVAGLIGAAAGILIQFLAGQISQSVPIGTILLLSAAGLVALGRWRWTLVISLLLTLFIFVMGFIAPGLFERLTHPDVVSAFMGTWIQEVGLIVALIAGIMANTRYFRT